MPRIPDQLLNSIAFLYQDRDSAISGTGAGGTGFFIKVYDRVFLITNIHVVGQGCLTARISLKNGDPETLDLTGWNGHPDGDDIAFLQVNLPEGHAVTPLDWVTIAATKARLAELNAGVGDELFMLGRFLALGKTEKNQPLARFGNVAMMPGDPVLDGRGLKVEAFLAEMRSLSGFSGSPVFIYMGPGTYRGNGTMMPFYSETIGLIGIDTGHFTYKSSVRGGPTLGAAVSLNSGIAIVSPVWKIGEAIADFLEMDIPYGK